MTLSGAHSGRGVGIRNMPPSLLKIDANVEAWRSLRAIAFNKLLSQLIEGA